MKRMRNASYMPVITFPKDSRCTQSGCVLQVYAKPARFALNDQDAREFFGGFRTDIRQRVYSSRAMGLDRTVRGDAKLYVERMGRGAATRAIEALCKDAAHPQGHSGDDGDECK